jgi:hypothetical protein
MGTFYVAADMMNDAHDADDAAQDNSSSAW